MKTFKRHYGYYTVTCILVFSLLQLFASEKIPEWFLMKWEGTLGGNYASKKYVDNLNGTKRLDRSEEDDIAVKCFPKNSDMENKLGLTTAEAHCLRNELAERQASLNMQTPNVTNIRLINFLVSSLQRNNCSQDGNTEIGSLRHNAEILKLELKDLEDKLQKSVTFLPLIDTRLEGDPKAAWFMSTLRVKSENGTLGHFYFPSAISNDRILCVQGKNTHDASQNFYGFAWKKGLPINSTLLPGLTLVSDSSFDYYNPWHGLTALTGFAVWQRENECAIPERFVLYHKGRLIKGMGHWIWKIMHASLGHHVQVDSLEYGDGPVCFEKAVINRQGLGGLTWDERIKLFDMIRCKTQKFCNVSAGQHFINGIQVVNLTLLARTGSRSFRNESIVANVLQKECNKVAGCNFHLAHVANLSFCDQISVMSMTDIVVTVHGAQLTNMIFMEKNSSVMEMFPRGWLELAGNGQNVFRWLAAWSGMKHEGTWRDTEGPTCPYPEKGRWPCFSFHKDREVGQNETYLASWTADVLQKFKNRTIHLTTDSLSKEFLSVTCPCDNGNAG